MVSSYLVSRFYGEPENIEFESNLEIEKKQGQLQRFVSYFKDVFYLDLSTTTRLMIDFESR